MKILSEAQTSDLVDESLALEAAREAFVNAATGALFPVVFGHGPTIGSRFSLKSGAAGDLVGVKIGSYWPDNDARGMSRHGSAIVLLDPNTGRICAALETATANAYRTAAADALAVQTLARPDANVLAIFGTGHQALYEVLAVAHVRPLARVFVVGRRAEAAGALVEAIRDQIGVEATTAAAEPALAVADILVTATTAKGPLFEAAWVAPGTHISAMGADVAGKQELPVDLYERARLFCDLVDQSRAIGEFQHANRDIDITPLGAVLAGESPGRRHPEEVTIFDSSGFALQDLTLAAAMLRADAR